MAGKVFLSAAFLIFSVGIIGAGDAKKDTERIQGNWTVVSHMNNLAKPTNIKDVKKLKVIIKGQTLKLSDDDVQMEMLFSLDPSKNPKAVDLELMKKKETLKGIYELDGDILKIAWTNNPKGERPKAFLTEPKEGAGMVVLKR